MKLKKSLGQNLLIDKNIIEKITSLEKLNNQTVLEIGPGSEIFIFKSSNFFCKEL